MIQALALEILSLSRLQNKQPNLAKPPPTAYLEEPKGRKFPPPREERLLPFGGRSSQTEAKIPFWRGFSLLQANKSITAQGEFYSVTPAHFEAYHLSIDHECCFLLENASSVQGVASYALFGCNTCLNCSKPMKSIELSGNHHKMQKTWREYSRENAGNSRETAGNSRENGGNSRTFPDSNF